MIASEIQENLEEKLYQERLETVEQLHQSFRQPENLDRIIVGLSDMMANGSSKSRRSALAAIMDLLTLSGRFNLRNLPKEDKSQSKHKAEGE